MYGEQDGLAPVGYSEAYNNAVAIPLDRVKYPEFTDAETRVAELVQLRNLRLIGTPFYTARYWVFKAVPC